MKTLFDERMIYKYSPLVRIGMFDRTIDQSIGRSIDRSM